MTSKTSWPFFAAYAKALSWKRLSVVRPRKIWAYSSFNKPKPRIYGA